MSMKIYLKSTDEIEKLRARRTASSRRSSTPCEAACKPGATTWDLDADRRQRSSRRSGAKSAFLGYHGYPAVLCTSVNEVVVHGIPRKDVVLKDGDIIGIDFGSSSTASAATRRGPSPSARSRDEAHEARRRDPRVARARPSSSARRAIGCGTSARRSRATSSPGLLGRARVRRPRHRPAMHEDPQVPNYGSPGDGIRLQAGLVLAIEPMVNAGAPEVEVLDDDWTAVTKDRTPVRPLRAHGRDHRRRAGGSSADRDDLRLRNRQSDGIRHGPFCRASFPNESPSIGQKDLYEVQGGRAQGRRAHHLREPAPQAAAGLGRSHGSYRRRRPPAQQAHRDRAHVHLRHRPPRGERRSSRRPASRPTRSSDDLDENDVRKIRDVHRDASYQVEGDLRREVADEHQAPDGPRLLPRPASPPGPAGPRPAHAHQRAHPQGPAQGQLQKRRPRSATDEASRSSAVEATHDCAKVKQKKKVKKNVQTGIAHIQSTFNNTIVTITDVNGNVVAWSSAGARGFKGSRKSTPFAAQLAAEDAAKKAMEHGMRNVAVYVKGPGSGRESALRALQRRGLQDQRSSAT